MDDVDEVDKPQLGDSQKYDHLLNDHDLGHDSSEHEYDPNEYYPDYNDGSTEQQYWDDTQQWDEQYWDDTQQWDEQWDSDSRDWDDHGHDQYQYTVTYVMYVGIDCSV